MGDTWFYSDPHYGHANIIKHAGRPFPNVHEMDYALEQNYRACVKPDDLVYWCGDCFWTKPSSALLAKLPGTKRLLLGNHDRSKATMLAMGFTSVDDKLDMVIAGIPVLVNHYPPRKAEYVGREHDDRFHDRRPIRLRSRVVIHGHTHEKIQVAAGRVHVGVDAWGFKPAHYDEVAALVSEALALA